MMYHLIYHTSHLVTYYDENLMIMKFHWERIEKQIILAVVILTLSFVMVIVLHWSKIASIDHNILVICYLSTLITHINNYLVYTSILSICVFEAVTLI